MDREEFFKELIWEIQDITGMSKKEILEQIYPDEVEYILRKKNEKEIRRYEDYRHTMIAIAAGFGAETEDGESLYKVYTQQLDKIISILSGEKIDERDNIDIWYEEYEELKSKENLTEEEEDRIRELKRLMNEHIDNEINKLRGLQEKQPKSIG